MNLRYSIIGIRGGCKTIQLQTGEEIWYVDAVCFSYKNQMFVISVVNDIPQPSRKRSFSEKVIGTLIRRHLPTPEPSLSGKVEFVLSQMHEEIDEYIGAHNIDVDVGRCNMALMLA